jgi:hypothetical protein
MQRMMWLMLPFLQQHFLGAWLVTHSRHVAAAAAAAAAAAVVALQSCAALARTGTQSWRAACAC